MPVCLNSKSFFFRKTKEKSKQKVVAHSQQSPDLLQGVQGVQGVEDTFAFQTIGKAKQTRVASTSASRPMAGCLFAGAKIPYSLKDSEVLSERDKVEILLNEAQLSLTKDLCMSLGSRIFSGRLLGLLEENSQPVWINVKPDSSGPEVNNLQIRRQGHIRDDQVEVVNLRRSPGQSIESFVLRGIENAVRLGIGQITPEQASHNANSQTGDLEIQYSPEDQAKAITSSFSPPKKTDSTDFYYGNTIPMDAPVSQYVQIRNLEELRTGNLHPVEKPYDQTTNDAMRQEFLRQMEVFNREYVSPEFSYVLEKEHEKSPVPSELVPNTILDTIEEVSEVELASTTPSGFHGPMETGEPSHANDEIQSDVSAQSESSPHKNMPLHASPVSRSGSRAKTSSEQVHEYLISQPAWLHSAAAKAQNGAERDLAKAQRSAKAMLPQSPSSVEQSEDNRMRDRTGASPFAASEERVENEMEAFWEKAATEAKNKATAADSEVKAAEARLKALKKTQRSKWAFKVMPQEKALHLAVREAELKYEQTVLDARKAADEAYYREEFVRQKTYQPAKIGSSSWEKAAIEAKNKAIADSEVKAAEAHLKALKKTQQSKWLFKIMPQEKALRLAIKEAKLRYEQAVQDARKAADKA